jgi:hypothetical protein
MTPIRIATALPAPQLRRNSKGSAARTMANLVPLEAAFSNVLDQSGVSPEIPPPGESPPCLKNPRSLAAGMTPRVVCVDPW